MGVLTSLEINDVKMLVEAMVVLHLGCVLSCFVSVVRRRFKKMNDARSTLRVIGLSTVR